MIPAAWPGRRARGGWARETEDAAMEVTTSKRQDGRQVQVDAANDVELHSVELREQAPPPPPGHDPRDRNRDIYDELHALGYETWVEFDYRVDDVILRRTPFRLKRTRPRLCHGWADPEWFIDEPEQDGEYIDSQPFALGYDGPKAAAQRREALWQLLLAAREQPRVGDAVAAYHDVPEYLRRAPELTGVVERFEDDGRVACMNSKHGIARAPTACCLPDRVAAGISQRTPEDRFARRLDLFRWHARMDAEATVRYADENDE